MGSSLLTILDLYVLWSQAVILGVKYKLTALKIHAAVCDLSVANRSFYKEVVIGYGGLYSTSFLSVLYMIIVDVKIMKGLWPTYLNVIAAILTLIFFIVLAMAYLESFM